jgi:hypothetical protein
VHLKPPVARSARKKLKIISGQTTGADTLRHNHPPYSLLRMSGGKTCDKQADQYIAKETGETSVVTSRNTVAAEDEVHQITENVYPSDFGIWFLGVLDFFTSHTL